MLTLAAERESVQGNQSEGMSWLKRWHEDGTTLWVYHAAADGCMSATLFARISELTPCLAFQNESSTVRFDLADARLEWRPLQAILTPSRLGRAAVVALKPGGLLGRNGVAIVLSSGHRLFACDATLPESEWLTLALSPPGAGGLLE